MGKITEYSNWCYIDQLDGDDIKDKEKLEIVWPNGKKEVIIVQLEETSYTMSDMGHPCEIPIKRAYASIQHNGSTAKVRLLGLKAKRVGKK